jgi:hypothetical protein
MAGEWCPNCGKRIRLADHLRGKFVRCPNCHASFVAGTLDTPTVPVEPRRPIPHVGDGIGGRTSLTARQSRTIIALLAWLVVSVTTTSCVEVLGSPRRQRWEYLITVPNDSSFDRELDRLGSLSWELVAVRQATVGGGASRECIFKRPKHGP